MLEAARCTCAKRLRGLGWKGEKKKSRHHVIVSSGWWLYHAGHFPGGGAARGDDQRIALSAGKHPPSDGPSPKVLPEVCLTPAEISEKTSTYSQRPRSRQKGM